MAEHPDAYQHEIATAFGVRLYAIQKALRQLGITHKKTQYTGKGRGVGEIAWILTEERVESPAYHLAQMGYGQHANKVFDDPYRWWASAPADILSKIEYMGHTANFKGEKPHFKSKKYVDRPREDWVVFENTHEAIVDP